MKYYLFAVLQGYSFGRAFSAELQQSIEEFDPNVVHFTVPDPVALHIMRWAKNNVRRFLLYDAIVGMKFCLSFSSETA